MVHAAAVFPARAGTKLADDAGAKWVNRVPRTRGDETDRRR